jgi:hypothetical protein
VARDQDHDSRIHSRQVRVQVRSIVRVDKGLGAAWRNSRHPGAGALQSYSTDLLTLRSDRADDLRAGSPVLPDLVLPANDQRRVSMPAGVQRIRELSRAPSRDQREPLRQRGVIPAEETPAKEFTAAEEWFDRIMQMRGDY